MAEESLVREVLTETMIAAGSELTRALDASGWPLAAAFWLFDPENYTWSLVLASPVVRDEGPRAAYERVARVLHDLKTRIPLENVTIVDPADDRVRLLASAYPSDRNVEGRRGPSGAIDGHFMDEAYIYRLRPVAPAA